jgi:hypothetical protein
MNKFKSLAVAFAAIALLLTAASWTMAQSSAHPTTPPNYCCGPRFTFGQAKAEAIGPLATTYGFFAGNGLVSDPTNNGGNAFLGNTIVVRSGMRRRLTYWYDWSADPQAVRKLSVWGNSIGGTDPLTIVYDPRTMLVISVTSPRIPPGPTWLDTGATVVVTRVIPALLTRKRIALER